MNSETATRLASLLVFAFSSNVPLGYLRESSRKFSFRWFALIHLSIPAIILLRVALGFSWEIIPLTLGCAVAGQMVGGRIKRNRP